METEENKIIILPSDPLLDSWPYAPEKNDVPECLKCYVPLRGDWVQKENGKWVQGPLVFGRAMTEKKKKPRLVIEVDFSEYPDIHRKILEEAEDHRSPGHYLLSLLLVAYSED